MENRRSLPVIHETVNHWIVHWIGHCQPIDSKVNFLTNKIWLDAKKSFGMSFLSYLNIHRIVYGWVGICHNEIDVVRKPADSKDHHHHDHHFHHLGRINATNSLFTVTHVSLLKSHTSPFSWIWCFPSELLLPLRWPAGPRVPFQSLCK